MENENGPNPEHIMAYAWDLGLDIQMSIVGGCLAIMAIEKQTATPLDDLRGMRADGSWGSWEDTLEGIKALESEFLEGAWTVSPTLH